MFGENLENAHDAMSDTIALRKITEYGAVSQGKNCQKLCILTHSCFHRFEFIQSTFVFLGGTAQFFESFFSF